jgi:hypothetical protein
LPKFVEQLNVLLNDLAKTGARIVLISPTPQENLGPPLPDPTAHNKEIKLYANAIQKVAAARGDAYVDLVTPLTSAFSQPTGKNRLTNNGIHLNGEGYRFVANAIARGLGDGPTANETNASSISAERMELLREAIIEKNHLYFYRYRPQNETYIYGFRKHEQGRNAAEIPEFDPLIAAYEKQMAAMLRPNEK